MTGETFATGDFYKLMYDAAPTAGIHMRGGVHTMEKYPKINLEFRSSDGRLLDIVSGRIDWLRTDTY